MWIGTIVTFWRDCDVSLWLCDRIDSCCCTMNMVSPFYNCFLEHNDPKLQWSFESECLYLLKFVWVFFWVFFFILFERNNKLVRENLFTTWIFLQNIVIAVILLLTLSSSSKRYDCVSCLKAKINVYKV